jgi:hypothetical protein
MVKGGLTSAACILLKRLMVDHRMLEEALAEAILRESDAIQRLLVDLGWCLMTPQEVDLWLGQRIGGWNLQLLL